MLKGFFQLIGLIRELVDWIKSLLGFIETAKHQKAQKEIADDTRIVGNPALSDRERDEATKRLEDRINRRT